MKMDGEFLEFNDLDWFAVCGDGFVAHFATGGKGIVPEIVKESIEKYEVVYDYFYSIDKKEEVYIIDNNIPDFSNPVQCDRYLESFVNMAERGLFSHDVQDDGTYKLIARPKTGITFSDLPEVIKSMLHVLPDNTLSLDVEKTILE